MAESIQVQIPEDIKEEMGEMVENLKWFFDENGIQINGEETEEEETERSEESEEENDE
jgi:hypothetical protein